jgi:hypothetical protein
MGEETMKKTSLIIMGFIIMFLNGCQKVSKDISNNQNKVLDNKNNSTVSSAKLNVDKENMKKDSENSKQAVGSSTTSSENKKPTLENSIALDLPVHIKTSKNCYFDIIEDDKYIYCSSDEGISKIDKKTRKYKIILKQMNINQITLSGTYLYFVSRKGDDGDDGVFRIDKDGNNFLKIFDVKQIHHKDVCAISGLSVIGSTLYMEGALIFHSYNMETKRLQLVVDDASAFEVVGNNIYYIDHAQRTFTIYKKNLKIMKTDIVLGKGESEPKKGILYRGFSFVGDKMYYYTSNPYGVYVYRDGKSITVSDKNMSWIHTFLKYEGDLYYLEEINDKDSKLMKVNTENNSVSKITVVKDYSGYWAKIVNGYLYYQKRDEGIESIRVY